MRRGYRDAATALHSVSSLVSRNDPLTRPRPMTQRTSSIVAVLIWSVISSSPIAHRMERPQTVELTLGLSGQSNASGVRPFLERVDRVVGYQSPSTPIGCWAVDGGALDGGPCWRGLLPALGTFLHAFVWWQGEADLGTPHYLADLDALIRHVRAANANLNLLVAIVQLGPGPSRIAGGPALDGERWVQMDAHAVYVRTNDLDFAADQIHMTSAGYAATAARIDRVVRARLNMPRSSP
jgi:Carbohydrate esterase, sialic acid-specific acetylesterase